MTPKSYLIHRTLILNTMLVAVFGVAYWYGVLDRFLVDPMYMTHGIIALFGVFLVNHMLAVIKIQKRWKMLDGYCASYGTSISQGNSQGFRDNLVASLSEPLRWSQAASSKLTDLGLIGTVVGIIVAFAALGPEVVSDSSAAEAAITDIVAGASTAFGTTLAGAVGAIWMNLNCRLAQADITRFHGMVVLNPSMRVE